MCGIFGFIGFGSQLKKDLRALAQLSKRRGADSSGLAIYDNDADNYSVTRADEDIQKLLQKHGKFGSKFVMGHSRLITNGLNENQPVCKKNMMLIHNGIIVNEDELWSKFEQNREQKIDSEAIFAPFISGIEKNINLAKICEQALSSIKGSFSCAISFVEFGKIVLISNTGSLYYGLKSDCVVFASERSFLKKIHVTEIKHISNNFQIFDIPVASEIIVNDAHTKNRSLIPKLQYNKNEDSILVCTNPTLKRCTKCILPETMPHIEFNTEGVCNYCSNYKTRNEPKPFQELDELLHKYRRPGEQDCILPFSGGRDSCFALHLAKKELGMNPIAYTYDWGMVTDLGRRNISRMCSELGVENIIVAADIEQKRLNIKKNLLAWLDTPHLGLLSLLTAGDKHFFRYVQNVKNETGIKIDLWGVNPLEVTHFKAGFLDIKPDFMEDKVYSSGLKKQMRYHSARFKAMSKNLSYFNSSLWDTLSGEYYRSILKKAHYFHIFDYWKWDEKEIDRTLEGYDWEKATDTTTTWRIGDGTAAFYNYIYQTVAGFTEHDTFRSNQIREGQLTRSEALNLINEENRPRYSNIRWYLDAVSVDYTYAITKINSIPRLYSNNKN